MRKESIVERAPPGELPLPTMGDCAVRIGRRSEVGLRRDVSYRGDGEEQDEGDHSIHFWEDVLDARDVHSIDSFDPIVGIIARINETSSRWVALSVVFFCDE